jgi:hypothetical protein
MTNKKADVTPEVTTDETIDAVLDNNAHISLEQICASIIKTLGSIEVSLEDLVTDYSNKSIAVNQDQETQAFTFTLTDSKTPFNEETVVEEASAETE